MISLQCCGVGTFDGNTRLSDSFYFDMFEKLTCVSFSQIAQETMLLPAQI